MLLRKICFSTEKTVDSELCLESNRVEWKKTLKVMEKENKLKYIKHQKVKKAGTQYGITIEIISHIEQLIE